MTLIQKEVKKIYIWKEPVIVSDMKGPCPNGFHVPTYNEMYTLYTAMDSLGMRGKTYWNDYLKVPGGGILSIYSGSVTYQSATSYYWTNTQYNSASPSVLTMSGSGSYTLMEYAGRGYGGSVRPFKDEVVNPISSGSTLKNGRTWSYHTGTNNYGITYNSSEGIISVSSDGTTWITIADKNAGATTVYNSGDTLSEANCGKHYQRGNNHGFTRGTVPSKTSSSQVNTSDYGPGNYYDNDTFIIYNPRDNPANRDIRGGVSQGTHAEGGGDIQIRPITYAESITLDKSTIALTSSGQTEQLTATIKPKNATHKKVLWSSSDTSIATVDSDGLVTCVTPGECTITATTFDGNIKAECSVMNSVWDDMGYFPGVSSQSTGAGSYYYGIAFTAKKNCKLIKFKVLATNGLTGTIKIAQGAYCSSNTNVQTQAITSSGYDQGDAGVYTLTTPYQLTANQTYTISFTGGTFIYKNGVNPAYTGTNVNILYSTYSGSNSQYTTTAYAIEGICTG